MTEESPHQESPATGDASDAKSRPPRITARGFLREMASEALDVDRGSLHTFIGMCTAPGHTMRRWVLDRDERLTRPFRYFLILVAAALLIEATLAPPDDIRHDSAAQLIEQSRHLGAANHEGDVEETISATDLIGRTVQFLRAEHREVLMVILIPFAAFGLWCAHRREGWYFAEYWVAITYAYAHSYVLRAILHVLMGPFTEHSAVIARAFMILLLVVILSRLHERPWYSTTPRTLIGIGLGLVGMIVAAFLLAIVLATAAQWR